jgi:hypothetical protein
MKWMCEMDVRAYNRENGICSSNTPMDHTNKPGEDRSRAGEAVIWNKNLSTLLVPEAARVDIYVFGWRAARVSWQP